MTTLLVQAHPEETEESIFERLVAIRPQAWPNSLMIGYADDRLGRGGRLKDAIVELYARRLKSDPTIGDVMRRLGRGREVAMGLARKA